jgi:hypothetical protein
MGRVRSAVRRWAAWFETPGHRWLVGGTVAVIGLALVGLGFTARNDVLVQGQLATRGGTASWAFWIAGALLFLAGVVVIVAPPFLLSRFAPTGAAPVAVPVAPPVAVPVVASVRSIPPAEIDVDTTPRELLELFKGHTDVQGQAHARAYINKWMPVAGQFADLSVNEYFCALSLKEHMPTSPAGWVSLYFDPKWADRLGVLKLGTKVRIRGQITNIDRTVVKLENCELL